MGLRPSRKGLDEGLVDDGDGGCGGGVFDGDSAAHEEAGSDGVEVFGVALDVGGHLVAIGLALNLNAPAGVVVLHWGVAADADLCDSGDLSLIHI